MVTASAANDAKPNLPRMDFMRSLLNAVCKLRQRHRCSSFLALCHRNFVCSYFTTVVLRRHSVLLQAGSVANIIANCNKSDSVGLLQHFSIRAVLASLPGEPTANRPIARQINRLRLKRLILGPTRRRTRRICSGNVQNRCRCSLI